MVKHTGDMQKTVSTVMHFNIGHVIRVTITRRSSNFAYIINGGDLFLAEGTSDPSLMGTTPRNYLLH